MNTVSGSTPQQ